MRIETVADMLTSTLARAGVKRIYGVAGDSLNAITDSLRKQGEIDWINVRHEESAAFAAGAEAHLTGNLAACSGSCGPGNLHLINGLFDCHRSRVPVLAIAAQIPSAEIGRDYFQETHPQNLFQECSLYCEMVTNPEQMPGVLETAIRVAAGERGVAVIVLPGDVALLNMPAKSRFSTDLLPKLAFIRPHDSELEALAEMLNGAERVTLLCGRGCFGARAEVLRLADALKSPIVHALGGKEGIEHDNPYDVGMTGLIGFSSGYDAMCECDMLLMLGTDFPYRQFYPTEAKIAQVDIRAANLGRRCSLDLGLIGDVAATIEALLPLLTKRQNDAHLTRCLRSYAEARKGLHDLAVGTPGRKPIHPQFLTKVVSELAANDTVFTCDVGTPTIWAARYLQLGGNRRLVGSFVHGSMASAMPQAIGAQAAFPGRQVVALCGDGGFTMLMGDFITLMQQKLPVKIVIFNNSSFGLVELEMKVAGLLETGVELINPDFASMARAMGVVGHRVEDPGDLEAAVRDVLAYDGPALLDVLTNRHELSMPPKTDFKHLAGFSLYLMKAVMNGRGDEVIELARTNLAR